MRTPCTQQIKITPQAKMHLWEYKLTHKCRTLSHAIELALNQAQADQQPPTQERTTDAPTAS